MTSLALVALSLTACNPDQKHAPVHEIHKGDHLTSFSEEITSPIHEFRVKAGDAHALDLHVTNTGTQPWFGGGQATTIALGYRWADKAGNFLSIEGNRAQLDRPVIRPGESDQLKLLVSAPLNPGEYNLRVSMVQEGVAWFPDRGAKPLVWEVKVD